MIEPLWERILRLTWPMAFALVFGGLPLIVFGVAVLCAYPAIMLPVFVVAMATFCYCRRQVVHAALAARCSAEYQHAAALVAAPLPDLPTVPMRGRVLR